MLMRIKTPSAKAATPPKSLPATALNASNAASYLGVSRAYFFKSIRPYIPFVDVARPGNGVPPVLRWRVSDLDAYLASRVRGEV